METNNGKDVELKTNFVTREGVYRLLNLSEYSRPNRVGYQSNQNSPQVRVSLVSLPSVSSTATQNYSSTTTQLQQQQQPQAPLEKGSLTTITANNNSTPNNNNGNNNSNSSAVININGPTSTITSSNSLSSSLTNGLQEHSCQNGVHNGGCDWICFNFGKELYTYAYRGVKKAADLSKPIDKKLYKGTNPSCHDFNQTTATCEGAPLLVGFTTGQIQLVYPGRREQGKLFNEERLIDKTKVTCLKWLPNSPNLFLAAHSSGHLYVYNEELPCSPTAPIYQLFKAGDGYSVLTCKSKSTRNPLYRWSFGNNSTSNGSTNSSSSSSSSSSTISSSSSSYSCASDNCSINEFSFSPCGANLAIVSQDGFLRVFNYESMELVGIARSYFGGFLCVCFSPDGKYIVVGGEDDLVTVYSLTEKRVVARGQGHRSWVSVVAFDPFTTLSSWDQNDFSDDENQYDQSNGNSKRIRSSIRDSTLSSAGPDSKLICYRLGSVSQDTQLCLWDITEDILRPHHHRVRLSTLDPVKSNETVQMNGDCSTSTAVVGDVGSPSNSNNNSHTFNNKIIANNACDETIILGAASGNAKKISNSSNSNNSSATKVSNTTSTIITSAAATASGEEKINNNNHHNASAFNTLTQRLTNFSFGSDKSSKSSGKKSFTLTSGSKGNSVEQKQMSSTAAAAACDGNSATSTLRNKSGSITTTFDALKLIGTPACPRFDDCPVLEPLICKKIAHERLTALIFREDCFLTACQDGFVYTWARPHSSHLATNSPTVPHNSSTIV